MHQISFFLCYIEVLVKERGLLVYNDTRMSWNQNCTLYIYVIFFVTKDLQKRPGSVFTKCSEECSLSCSPDFSVIRSIRK